MDRRDGLILGLLLTALTVLSWYLVGILGLFGLKIDLWAAWMLTGLLIYGVMVFHERRKKTP